MTPQTWPKLSSKSEYGCAVSVCKIKVTTDIRPFFLLDHVSQKVLMHITFDGCVMSLTDYVIKKNQQPPTPPKKVRKKEKTKKKGHKQQSNDVQLSQSNRLGL